MVSNTAIQARLDLIDKRRNDGIAWYIIAREIGISPFSLYDFVKKHNPELLNRQIKYQKQLKIISDLRNEGQTWKEIAAKQNVNSATLYNFVKRHAPEILQREATVRKRAERLRTIMGLRRKGLNWNQIAKQLKCSPQSVSEFIQRHQPKLIEEKILTDHQLERLNLIATMRKSGATWLQISAKLGISMTAARNFTNRHNPNLLD